MIDKKKKKTVGQVRREFTFRYRILFLLCFPMVGFVASAQSGRISGRILDGKSNEAIIGATVLLHEDLSLLDEVVVVGYGTQKRKELTGAISTVSKVHLEYNVAPSVRCTVKRCGGRRERDAGFGTAGRSRKCPHPWRQFG